MVNARKTEKLRAKVTGGERNGGGPTTVTMRASTTEGWRGQVRGGSQEERDERAVITLLRSTE